MATSGIMPPSDDVVKLIRNALSFYQIRDGQWCNCLFAQGTQAGQLVCGSIVLSLDVGEGRRIFLDIQLSANDFRGAVRG